MLFMVSRARAAHTAMQNKVLLGQKKSARAIPNNLRSRKVNHL
jgi:hypothetical protein